MRSWLLLIACVGVGACTTILGNDFEIAGGTASGGDGGTGNVGGSGAAAANGGAGGTGGGNQGGGGSGAGVPMFACDWVGPVERVESLAGQTPPLNEWSHQLHSVRTDHGARIFVEHYGRGIEMHYIDESTYHISTIDDGRGIYELKGSGTRQFLLFQYENPTNGGRGVKVFAYDDTDEAGVSPAQARLLTDSDWDDLEATFALAGNNGSTATVGDIAFAATYRFIANGGPFEAHYGLYTGTTEFPGEFFRDASGPDSADFEFTAMLRDSTGTNQIFMGAPFEGGALTRRFAFGDTPTSAETADSEYENLLPTDMFILSVNKRANGEFSFTIAEPLADGKVSLRMASVPEDNLDTFALADASVIHTFDNFNVVPTNGAFQFTGDGTITIGTRAADPTTLGLFIAQRIPGMRADVDLPFPVGAPLPTNYTIEGATVVVESDTFEVSGGDVLAVFTVVDTDTTNGDQVMLKGTINCSPGG